MIGAAGAVMLSRSKIPLNLPLYIKGNFLFPPLKKGGGGFLDKRELGIRFRKVK